MEKAKKSKYTRRAGLILALVWLLAASFVLSVSAATSGSGSTSGGEFSWSWATNNTKTNAAGDFSGSVSGETLTLTISATSSTYIPKKEECGVTTQERVDAASTTNIATVVNDTGSTISIIDVSATDATCKLLPGTLLADGDSFDISIKAEPQSLEDSTARKKSGTVVVSYRQVENVDVIYYGADGATYAFNEMVLDSATDFVQTQAAVGTSVTLPDAPTVNIGSFAGWRLSHDGSLRAAGETVVINNDTSVYPVLTAAGMTEPFTVNEVPYIFWTDAAKAAGNNGTIILNQNYSLPTTLAANGVSIAGSPYISGTDGNINYIIPKGVTLLIPYSDENISRGKPNDWTLEDFTLDSSRGFPDPPEVNIVSAKVYKDTPNVEYRRLTMAEGAHITVNGSLEVSGQTHPLASGQWGNYAVLQMGSNTSITVGSTGTLYAYGYIRGNGTVTVASSGVVYEHYDVADYPPGGAGGLDPMNTAGVFGMTNYSFNNIEVPTTYNAGAELRAYLVMTGYNIGTNAFTRTFIGSDSNAIFCLKNGTITKTYSGTRQGLVIAGDLEFNKLYLYINGYEIVEYTVDSSKTSGLPISHNWDITITNNSTATLNGSVLVYAGSTITVDSGSKIVIPSNIKLSLLDPDSDPSDVTGNAVLDVNGEIHVNGGFYTSYKNSNIPIIKSSGGTGKVIVNNVGTETTFNVRASGDNTASVDITPAKLQNSDKTTYVETASGTGTYNYINGFWHKGTCADNAGAAATCATAQTCTVCGKILVAATGNHTFTVEQSRIPANCMATGSVTLKCANCTKTNVETLVKDPSNHTGKNHTDNKVDATCGEAGYTGDTVCECGVTIVSGTPIPATGNHSYSAATYTAASTCSVCTHTVNSACIGDTSYTTLKEAVEAAEMGSTITLLANISGEVPVGKALTIQCDEYTVNIVPGDGFAMTELAGVVTVYELTVKIAGTSVTAGDCLDIYFYVDVSTLVEGESYYAVITRTKLVDSTEGKYTKMETSTLNIDSKDWSASGNYLRFCYQGIAAKEMTDPVSVTIYDTSGQQVSATITESVESYALRSLEKHNNDPLLHTTLVDMLNYGAAAQTYFGYKTGDLANAELTSAQKALATKDDAIATCSNITTWSGYTLAGATVTAESNLYFTFYFEGISDPNVLTAEITYTDHRGNPHTTTIRGEDFIKYGDYCGPRLEDIAVADGNVPITCTLKENDVTVATATSSVVSYAVATVKEHADNVNLVALCNMMMKFISSSHAYFHQNDSAA